MTEKETREKDQSASFKMGDVLKSPDGKSCTEGEGPFDSEGRPTRQVDLTLGSFVYKCLMTPRPGDDKLSATQSLKLGSLARRVSTGGVVILSVSDRKVILDRLPGWPQAIQFAVYEILDPSEIEKAESA